MKTQRPIPKNYYDGISFKSRKQTQTRSTINSGRSTNYEKRNSHDISYQTQILRNLNKSAVLCLNNQQNLSSNNSISHKVIIENRQKSKKVHQSIKNESKINQTNMKKIKKQIVENKSKNKTKSNSLESVQTGNKFYSHRQSLNQKNHLNQPSNTYRVNSQDKQNMCSNKPHYFLQENSSQSIQKYKANKPLISENRPPLGKLTFIIEKDFKEKKNLTKKRLLLSSNESLLKENLKHRAQTYELPGDQNQIRNSSKSNNSSNKPFGSGRVHSIQKKKENLSYLKTKSIHISQGQNIENQLSKNTENQFYKNNKKDIKENFQSVENSIETSQSVSHKVVKPSPDPSRSSYSIKSFLKEFMYSQESNELKMRKIGDSITPKDKQSVFAEQNKTKCSKDMLISQNLEKQSEKGNQFCLKSFLSKINSFQQPNNSLQEHESIKRQVLIQKCNVETQDNAFIFNRIKSEQNRQKTHSLLKFYQRKIIDLYEELIREKQKRYQLEQMIEKYIIEKQSKTFHMNY